MRLAYFAICSDMFALPCISFACIPLYTRGFIERMPMWYLLAFITTKSTAMLFNGSTFVRIIADNNFQYFINVH